MRLFLFLFCFSYCIYGTADTLNSDTNKIATNGDTSFVAFESGQVRPMALSSDGAKLFVVNTPDNRLEIFDLTQATPKLIGSVFVGMEPVAVALKNDSEAWVVNHLSDSISIVNLKSQIPYVEKTLLVADEPRDIVFAGPNKSRAFITCAHRGQNVPFDPQLSKPGIGRADVWVYDTEKNTNAPITIINLFSDTPRALAVDAQGRFVYVAAFNSGNRTTVLKADMQNGGLKKAAPLADLVGARAPKTGLIVKFDGKNWVDGGDPVTGTKPKIWTDRVRFNLPDKDVFVIDSFLNTPKEVASYSGVGTTLFNMVVNPVSGHVYVSNTEAMNQVRFAASGTRSSTLRGHFIENRISVLADSKVVPHHLNKHIKSYGKPLGSPQENVRSLAIPMAMDMTHDGKKLYVAAFGSGKIGIFNTAELENDSFDLIGSDIDLSANISYRNMAWKSACILYDAGDGKWVKAVGPKMTTKGDGWFSYKVTATDYSARIAFAFNDCNDKWDNNDQRNYQVFPGVWKVENGVVSGENRVSPSKNEISVAGGPSGLVLDEKHKKLYVFSRFDSVISVIDTESNRIVNKVAIYNPEPMKIVKGRPFLYDANLSSSRGDASCASCHVFGDSDHLAWDLGNPDGIVAKNPNKYLPVGRPDEQFPYYHPMKGPMLTQSLRGMTNNGPMHWRGDKTGELGDAKESQEMRAFQDFNGAFEELLGNDKPLPKDQMKSFALFSLSLKYPPNPNRNLDNSLTAAQAFGKSVFYSKDKEELINCIGCHAIDPKNKKFTTVGLMNGTSPLAGRSEDLKIPHLRNIYEKVGMFGSTGHPNDGEKFMGDQVSGFGFNHDGATDTINTLLSGGLFVFSADKKKAQLEKDALAKWLFAIDSDIAPIVGQQVTIDSESSDNPDTKRRIQLLLSRAGGTDPAIECDLIFKGIINGESRGGYFDRSVGKFQLDRRADEPLALADVLLLSRKSGNSVTFTAVPYGSGARMGINRKGDDMYDGDVRSPSPIMSSFLAKSNSAIYVRTALFTLCGLASFFLFRIVRRKK